MSLYREGHYLVLVYWLDTPFITNNLTAIAVCCIKILCTVPSPE